MIISRFESLAAAWIRLTAAVSEFLSMVPAARHLIRCVDPSHSCCLRVSGRCPAMVPAARYQIRRVDLSPGCFVIRFIRIISCSESLATAWIHLTAAVSESLAMVPAARHLIRCVDPSHSCCLRVSGHCSSCSASDPLRGSVFRLQLSPISGHCSSCSVSDPPRGSVSRPLPSPG